MDKKNVFIVNPIAGRGAGKLALPEIAQMASELSLEYEIISTEYPGHAIQLAEQAAIADVGTVIGVGGDGTRYSRCGRPGRHARAAGTPTRPSRASSAAVLRPAARR